MTNLLFALKVLGISGNPTGSYSSFTVQTIPELKILRDRANAFQEALATFQKAPQGYSGIVDVFYDQSLIFSKQDPEATVYIKRTEILEGLRKSRPELHDAPSYLVFSLRAANGSENWQQVDFK